MQIYQPKVIEKELDLLCRLNHPQPIEFVILDPQLSRNQRLLCKSCGQQSQSNSQIMDYQFLKYCFDKQQKESILEHESIIMPHIQYLESLQNKIESLKTRLIQILDYLIWLTKNWITNLIDSVIQYSFFEELEKLISRQMKEFDKINLIATITKIHQDGILKINPKLDQFKFYPEFKGILEIFENLNSLIFNQELELKSQPIIKSKNSLLYSLLEQEGEQNWQISTEEHKLYCWDACIKEFFLTTLKIEFTKDNEILYIKDESIIRCDKIIDLSQKPVTLTNLEQIKYLQWVGDYGKNNKKIGKWTVNWQGEVLNNVSGEYTDEGKKQGKWIDLFENYSSESQVLEIGEYLNNQRQGLWISIYEDQEIGSGEYNSQGKKNGKWIELSERFFRFSQVTYKGEYNNGTKVGKWEILLGNTKMQKI
ncbi:unnamed protein product [Paramecium octaurelia]|uniref:MORN repeat protein n=1 Tax=Paramecium octaurelia TaxID=43137 RepID=A0A8S1YRZ1_PAROT|nr:unnamed protein product [Paramecium octaurelia]